MARRIPTAATALLATCLLGGGGALADQTRPPPRFSDLPSAWRLGERLPFVSLAAHDLAGGFDWAATPGRIRLLEAQPVAGWLSGLSSAGRHPVPPPPAADDAARVVGPGPASTLLVATGAAFAARAGWRRV